MLALLLGGGIVVPAAGPATRTPVLVELFTSEGCSSCPPADRLLESLDRVQPVPGAEIVVLSEHVDYWDRLGWKDSFSSAAYTSRQQTYGRRLHVESVYTPQMVIDGRDQVLGSDAQAVKEAVARSAANPKLPVAISGAVRKGRVVQFLLEVPRLPEGSGFARADVWVALAGERAESAVSKGENSGRRLTHVAVARRLSTIGEVTRRQGFRKTLELTAGPGAGRIIAVVQQIETGPVAGIGVAKFGE